MDQSTSPSLRPLYDIYDQYDQNPIGFMNENKVKTTAMVILKLMSLAAQKALDMAADNAKLDIYSTSEPFHVVASSHHIEKIGEQSTTINPSKDSITELKRLFV